MAQEPQIDPVVEGAARELLSVIRDGEKQAGRDFHGDKTLEELPEATRSVLLTTAAWALSREDGMSPAARARIAELEQAVARYYAEVEELRARNELPLEPIDPFSLYPITRTQETEAAVQESFIGDAMILGSKKLEQFMRRAKIQLNAQVILAIGIAAMLALTQLKGGPAP